MIKEKIIEKISRKMNKNLPLWYQDKVIELAGFFVKKLKEENIPINNAALEHKELEVMIK
jgi:hypothetical protein